MAMQESGQFPTYEGGLDWNSSLVQLGQYAVYSDWQGLLSVSPASGLSRDLPAENL